MKPVLAIFCCRLATVAVIKAQEITALEKIGFRVATIAADGSAQTFG